MLLLCPKKYVHQGRTPLWRKDPDYSVGLKDAEITFQVLEPETDMRLNTADLEKVLDLDSAQRLFLFLHILSFILIFSSVVFAWKHLEMKSQEKDMNKIPIRFLKWKEEHFHQ